MTHSFSRFPVFFLVNKVSLFSTQNALMLKLNHFFYLSDILWVLSGINGNQMEI